MRSLLKRFSVTPAILLVALLGLGACSGDSDDKKGGRRSGGSAGDAASFDDVRSDAVEQQEEADSVDAQKYVTDKYNTAVENLAKADELREDPDVNPSKINSLYKKAQRGFKSAAQAATTAKKDFDKLQQYQKKFEDAVAKQDKAKLPYKEIDSDGWQRVTEKVAEAKELISEKKFKSAWRRYDKATRDFRDVVRQTERKLSYKTKAEEARDQMNAAKLAAEEAQAAKLATDSMAYADSEARHGLEKLSAGEYSMAESHFVAAMSTYNEAKSSAMYAAAIKENPPADSNETASLNGNPREEYREAPKIEPKPGGGGDDEDDEGGFADGMTVLLSSLHGDPDWDDGMLTLTYGAGNGLEMKKDLAVASAKSDKHLLFYGSAGVGNSNYVVAGNTGGMILFEPIFKDQVRIEVDFKAQLNMANSPSFELIINAKDTKNYISTWYASDIRICSGGNSQVASPCGNRDWTKHPNNWLDRKESQTMILQYHRKEDEKKGLVSVYHAGAEPCAKLPTKRSKGRVGIRWYNAKWYITEIRITGRVDDEWMEEFVAKHSDAVNAAGSDDEDEEEAWEPEKKEPKREEPEEDDDDLDF